jgi:SAM-dependent methyltransferase
MPDNLRFELEDVTQGLSYPDAHFDVIHSRLMLAGVSRFMPSEIRHLPQQIRDWDAYLNECIRLLKPGGLVVFYDMADCFRQAEDIKREDLDKVAPAFAKWSHLVEK